MSKFRIRSAIFILTFFWCLPFHAKESKPSFTYKVISVLDGDTFIATDGNIKFKVRIAAMDAPERGQPYGKVAKYRLEVMLKSKHVTIKPVEKVMINMGEFSGMSFWMGRMLLF